MCAAFTSLLSRLPSTTRTVVFVLLLSSYSLCAELHRVEARGTAREPNLQLAPLSSTSTHTHYFYLLPPGRHSALVQSYAKICCFLFQNQRKHLSKGGGRWIFPLLEIHIEMNFHDESSSNFCKCILFSSIESFIYLIGNGDIIIKMRGIGIICTLGNSNNAIQCNPQKLPHYLTNLLWTSRQICQ